MGKASKALKLFITNIPDDKLSGFTDGEHTLYKDDDYRLDQQGLTTGDPQYYNLHVQVNNETSISTLKREKGKTVANTLVPTDGSWNPSKIRSELLVNMKV